MDKLKIVVVGNKFREFANNKNIFTYIEFLDLIKIEGKLHDSQNKYTIYLGQGLNDALISSIQEQIVKPPLSDRFFLTRSILKTNRAKSYLTHKIKSENNMISEPEKVSSSEFKSHLLLDEECAEMSDHITGQHIQGMVLIEACRQMVNSVSEKYLISDHTNRKGFVLNSLNTTFIEYVFPLEAELLFTMTSIRHGLGGNFKAEASIKVLQCKKIMLQVDVAFSVMDKATLLNIESQMAELSVDRSVTQHQLSIVQQKNAA